MERFHLAKNLAQEAGEMLSEFSRKGFEVRKKEGGSFVTDADTAVERHILDAIRREFPDDRIVAEESGQHRGTSGFVWYVDPVDGTTNFIHGIPLYAVSIGVFASREPVCGVIALPALSELYEAESGKGAYLNGKPIRVSSVAALSDAVVMPASPRFTDSIATDDLPLAKLIQRVGKVRILGSVAVECCWVARGLGEGGIFYQQKPWDVAAGVVLIREAGGTVASCVPGSPDILTCNLLITSNGILHDAMIALCA